MRSRFLIRGGLTTFAVAILSAATAAATTPSNGTYASSKAASQGAGKGVVFTVAKSGSSRKIEHLYIQCYKNDNSFGSVQVMKTFKVSKSGKFSYRGKATTLEDGAPLGTAKIKISGKFVSATKAKGTVSFTAKPKPTGCSSKRSFTAKKLG